MKGITWLILFLVLPFSLLAQDDYQPSELPGLVGDFALSAVLCSLEGGEIFGPVENAAVISISAEPAAANEVYSLSLYIDHSFVAKEEKVTLPYDFKWNFRGLPNGVHELLFTLKDSKGNLGVLRIYPEVQH